MIILKVDPGGYCPCVALFTRIELFASALIWSQSSEIVFGLKSGLLTMARILPVSGSITTTAPFRSLSASYAVCCNFVFSVVQTLSPTFFWFWNSFCTCSATLAWEVSNWEFITCSRPLVPLSEYPTTWANTFSYGYIRNSFPFASVSVLARISPSEARIFPFVTRSWYVPCRLLLYGLFAYSSLSSTLK